MLGEFGIEHPDVPGLRGAHGLAGGATHVIEMREEIGAGEVAAQQDLVADHDTHDVAVLLCETDRLLDLALVADTIGIEPRANRHPDAVALCERRHLAHRAERAVSADCVGLAFEQRQVRVDLRDRRLVLRDRILVLLVRLECKGLEAARPGGFRRRAVGNPQSVTVSSAKPATMSSPDIRPKALRTTIAPAVPSTLGASDSRCSGDAVAIRRQADCAYRSVG